MVSVALRSRHGGRPGSATSSFASAAASASTNGNNGTRRSARRTSKTRRPAAALAWWAILLLTASAILILMMGKRGIRRGLYELQRLFGTRQSSKAAAGIRGTGASTNDVKFSQVDQALLDLRTNSARAPSMKPCTPRRPRRRISPRRVSPWMTRTI